MNKWKPTVEDIISLRTKGEEYYGNLFREYETDDKYFELDILELLGLPKENIPDGIVLPIGRQLVYTYADHVDTTKATVHVNKKGDSKRDEEESDMERKFGQGVLYRNNVEASVAPLRTAAIHQGEYGRGVIKTVFDADMWPDKPEQKKGESDEAYDDRLDEFRQERGSRLPIRMVAVNPRSIIPDWSYGGQQWVIETQDKVCIDVKGKWKKWGNPQGKKAGDLVKVTSFWNPWFRGELADDEPLFRIGDGVIAHKYGFIPYTIMDSGLGNLSYDNAPEKQVVGLLRHIRGVMLSASRNYSLADISYKKGGFPWYTIEGENASQAAILRPEYGIANPLPPGTKVVEHLPLIVPEAVNRHWERTLNVINEFAAPRSVQGLSDTGVRSAAQEYARQSAGGVRFNYPMESFRNGVDDILGKSLLLQKRVIPEGVRVWARTPTDEWDIVIDPKKIREPVTFYVTFAADEADRYRKNDDIERRVKGTGLSQEWAWQQMDDVNVHDEQVRKIKEQLFATALPAILALADINKRKELGVPLQPPQLPAPQPGAVAEQGGEPGRRVIAPSSPKPMPGTAAALQNGLESQRSQVPMSATQGRGGGGS
ncbi:MAG: hypothetical protein WC657_06570 [Candidatus Paceibacterota bacterium]